MSVINQSLESQYNNRALVPEHPAIFERWRANSAAFRANHRCTLDIQYGPEARHRLDIFHAKNPRGTLIFIHGGYWRSLDKSDFSFVAAPFVKAGISVAAINYQLCPQVEVADIVEDCRDAISWLIANGAGHDLTMSRIALAGHSAGGHLVSMMYATKWMARGVPPDIFLGGAAVSGVYDLSPLLECSMNADLHLSDASAHAVSPVHLTPQLNAPLFLITGSDESAAFCDQSRHLHDAWPNHCSRFDIISGCNHFTIVDAFVAPDNPAGQFIRQLFD